MAASSMQGAGKVHCPVEISEKQYNLRAAFPDYPKVREGWVSATQALKQCADWQTHAYGTEPLQNLDFYSTGDAKAPLLVFVHGGYWQGGDKDDVGFIATPYLRAGIAVAVINYSLAPQARVETMVQEVHAALRWLVNQASTLGFDANRVSLMGHSAGGHLVSMMVAGTGADGKSQAPAIANVFPISGVFDIEPLLPSSVNQALGLDVERAAQLSPVSWPGPQQVYLHTFVGADETEQFHEQSAALARVWQVAAHDSVPATHHFTVLDELADPDSVYSQAVVSRING